MRTRKLAKKDESIAYWQKITQPCQILDGGLCISQSDQMFYAPFIKKNKYLHFFLAKYRESYVHPTNLEDEWSHENGDENILASSEFAHRHVPASDLYKKDRQNRYSIISDAASSSTSGIVSDRTCFSYYDSQGEKTLDVHNKIEWGVIVVVRSSLPQNSL